MSAYVGCYVPKVGAAREVLATRDNGRRTPGRSSLVEAVLAYYSQLEAHAVNIDEDATPPAHQSS